jgi:pilus assembly protein CpaB
MRARTVVLVVLALAFGGSAALGVHRWQMAQQSADVNTVPVVTAALDVPRGSKLTADAIRVKHWPKSMVPGGALAKLEDAEGQTVKVPLISGEPILKAKVTKEAIGSPLSSLVDPGMRAFTIRTPHIASGVGGFIRPHDRVDVLLTTTSQDKSTGGSVTTTLLQNIEILAVDQEMDSQAADEAQAKAVVKSVTLLVTPGQASKLALATNRGLLNLSLRNHRDPHEADTQPATMAGLRFDQEGPLAPSRIGSILGSVAGAVAGAAMTSGVQVVPKPAKKKRVVRARIDTIRGVHRGTVHIQMVK